MSNRDHLFLLRELVKRDFRSRYAGSALGILWSVLQPLWQLLLFTFVFSRLMETDLSSIRARTDSFPIFLFGGLVVWIAVSEGISRSATAITENGMLVKKLSFPPELLVLTVVVSGLIQSGLAALVFVVVLLVGGHGDLSGAYVLLLVVPLQVALTLGCGFLVATLNVFVRDIAQMLQILLQTWFFLTPIIYPLTGLRGYRVWIELNPLTGAVELYRHAFLGGQMATPRSMLSLAIAAVVFFAVGYTLFRRCKPIFVDEV